MKQKLFLLLIILIQVLGVTQALAGETLSLQFYKIDDPNISEIGLNKEQMKTVFDDIIQNESDSHTIQQLKDRFAIGLKDDQKKIYFVTPPLGFEGDCEARLGGSLDLYQKKGQFLKQIEKENIDYQYYSCDYDYELKTSFNCQINIGFFPPRYQYFFYELTSNQLSKIGITKEDAEKIFSVAYGEDQKIFHEDNLREKTLIAKTGENTYLAINQNLSYCKASGLYGCDTVSVKYQNKEFMLDKGSKIQGQYVCDEDAIGDKYCCLPQSNKEMKCPDAPSRKDKK